MTYSSAFVNCVAPLNGKRICFSIPGEADDGFLSQIAMFNLALRKIPGPLSEARVIAYLGCEAETRIPERWQQHLRDVEIRFVQRPASTYSYMAQASKRFTEDDPTLDYVILCDADTLILGDLDDVFRQLACGFPIAGVIAHMPPPQFTNDHWKQLSTKLTGTPIALPHAYTLLDQVAGSAAGSASPAHRSPFYVNHGFLAFRADALRDFATPYLQMRKTVTETLEEPFFAGQIALALTLHALKWKGATLPMRYNFPNDDRAVALHSYEAQDVRFLHYLRERSFKRSEIFSDAPTFRRFLEHRPEDSNRIVFDAFTRLTNGIFPF